MMEPIYYWLDLYGPDGRPSHTKVLGAWGYFLALYQEFRWAATAEDITMTFVTLVALTLALPMGKGVFVKMIDIVGARMGFEPQTSSRKVTTVAVVAEETNKEK